MINVKNSKPQISNSLLPALRPYSLPPDFWSRQANTQTESFEFTPFGIPARITANRSGVLSAAHLSARRFSLPPTPPIPDPQPLTPIQIQLVVTKTDTPAVPANLPEQLQYAGVGDWISLSAGPWGHAFAHLPTRTAAAFLSPALAAETRLVSRYIIDHYLLNFILTEWAMLHASCVLDPTGQRLILMVAPHNTGKSTTALYLLRAGYIFLADGMALLRQRGSNFVVGGYPIGEVKLRDDVLALFPHYSGQAVKVREQRKTVINLRAAHPDGLAETLFSPKSIQLCLVERNGFSQTEVAPLIPAEAWPTLAANSVYWDIPERLDHNAATLQALLESASLYRLKIGSDPEGIVSALSGLS
ncbi:MAG: hypothetical protein HS126_20720 [Anaerolineales bacterium]|nr:hypothetical protein [Anaerolineales bacterium]